MANFHGKFEIRIIKQAIPSHLEFKSNAIGESVTAGSLAEDIKADLRRWSNKPWIIGILFHTWSYGMLEAWHYFQEIQRHCKIRTQFLFCNAFVFLESNAMIRHNDVALTWNLKKAIQNCVKAERIPVRILASVPKCSSCTTFGRYLDYTDDVFYNLKQPKIK